MARSFNGTSDKIVLASGFGPTGSISISCWITFGSTANFSGAILGGSTGYEFRWTGASSTTGTLTLNKSFVADIGDSAVQTVSTGTWYHVGVSYDLTNLNFYWNGVNVGTSSNAQTIPLGTYDVGHLQGGSEFWNGSLADLAVWTSILKAAQFLSLAKGARPWTLGPATNLWTPLDGLQSPEPDLSGNAFNGTLTGTAAAFGPPFMQFTPRSPHLIPRVVAAGGGPAFIAARAIAANLIYEGFAT